MATKVIVCPECESPLVPGRFSCSGCGALLASVASVSRSFSHPEPVSPPPVEPAPPAQPVAEAWAAAVDDGPGEATAGGEAWDEPEAEPVVAAYMAPAPPAAFEPDRMAVDAAIAQPLAPAPAWPEQPAWPPDRGVRVAPVAPVGPERTPAGAYLPPSAVLPSGESLPVAGATAAAAPRPSLAERLALGEGDGPLGLPANAPGRTIALGASIAGFGFLLPWAEIVIGTSSMGSFLDQWGLAAPGHALVFLLLLGVGALAVAHERVPVTVGAGLPAIVLGSVLLGLVFPYVMGPFHEAVGVYVVAAGGIVMIVGGLLARAAARHATEDASV